MKYADIMENNLINPRSNLDRVIFSEYGILPTDVSGTYKANEFLGEQFKRIIDASGESAYDRGVQLQMASLVKDTLGYSFDQSLAMVESGDWTGELSDRIAKKPTAFQAMGHSLRGSYYTKFAGKQFSKFMVTGDDRYLQLYEEYTEKARREKVGTDDWGFLSNLAVKSASAAGSSADSMIGSLGIRWATTGLGWLLGGPAGAAVGNNIGRLISNAFVLIDSGMSQAGNDFAELYYATDANGKRLDLDSPMARLGFYGDLLVNGAVEVVGLEFIPAYKNLLKTLGPDALSTAFKFTWKDAIRKFGVDEIESIFGEGSEEFMQGIVSDSIKNAIYAYENKTGKNFDLKPFGNIISDASKAFSEAAQGMVVYGALSNGLSLGVGSVIGQTRMAQQANKNQTEQDDSVVIDRRIILTPKTGQVQEKADGENQQGSDEKLDVVNVIRTKKGAVPASVEDAQTLAALDARGASVVRVNPVEATVADESTARSSKENLAYMFGLQRDAETGKYVIESSAELDGLERSVKSLRGILDVSRNGDTLEFSYMTNDSKKVEMSVSVQQEGMVLEDVDADLDEVSIPYYGALVSQDQYDEYALRKELTDRIASATGGAISKKTLRAGVDSMIVASRALGINEDEFLDKHVQVRFATDDEAFSVSGGRKVNGYMVPQKGKNGDVVYSINLTSNADASTLVHEVGHVLRAMATEDQLKPFAEAYGGHVGGMWLNDITERDGKFVLGDRTFDTKEAAEKVATENEERFADDFVVYLKTGSAPNEEMKGLFARMKEFLKNVYNAMKDRLSPSAKKAFDDLLNSGTYGEGSESGVLFQSVKDIPDIRSQYKEVEARYRNTDAWMKAPNGKPTNLTERQWIQVRTPAFKKWFGDWMGKEAINRVVNSQPFAVDVSSIPASSDLKAVKTSAANFGKTLTGSYTNLSDGFSFNLTTSSKFGSLKEILEHDYKDVHHLQSIAAIPYIAENSQFVTELKNDNPKKPEIDRFRYYVSAISIDGFEYMVKSIISIAKDGNRYYDHKLTELAKIKEFISSSVNQKQTDSEINSSHIKDKRLLQIIQEKFDSSKVVDENGEPLVVYHGSQAFFDTFDFSKLGNSTGVNNTQNGFYFTDNVAVAKEFGYYTEYSDVYETKAAKRLIQDTLALLVDDHDYSTVKHVDQFSMPGDVISGKEMRRKIETAQMANIPFFAWNGYSLSELLTSIVFAEDSKNYGSFAKRLDRLEKSAGVHKANVYAAWLNLRSPYHSLPIPRGYDGAIITEADENADNDIKAYVNRLNANLYVVKESSTQIKSATDNVGAFDPENPNILFQDQTRTPEFKAWFGDWEAVSAVDWVLSANPVAESAELMFQKDGSGSLIDRVLAYWGNRTTVSHPELGVVVLDKEGVKSSIGHGIGKEKASGFALVPRVIEDGRIISRETNWKNRGYDTAVIAAPIRMGGVAYVAEVVVIQRPSSNKFYLHEVEIKERLEGAFKTPTEGSAPRTSRLIISKLQAEGKLESSKVVDENGEPLVVYHATDTVFDTFDLSRLGESTDSNTSETNGSVLARLGIWTSRDPVNRKTFQAISMPLYVNIRNPYRTTFDELWDRAGDSDADALRTELQDEGYDGIILDDSEFDTESYVVFSNTQIKSATSNLRYVDDQTKNSTRLRLQLPSVGAAGSNASANNVLFKSQLVNPDRVDGGGDTLFQLAQDGDIDGIVDYFGKTGIIIDKDDIVLYDGKIAVKDDPGQDYDVERLRELHDAVSEQLWLFNPDKDSLFDETDVRGIPSEEKEARGTGILSRNNDRRSSVLRSTLPDHFVPKKGWDGYERTPTRGPAEAWDTFGFVSFIGAQVDSVADLVQMYSLYRNPNLEYFHIVLLKDNRIVRQTAISSGLSGITFVVPADGYAALEEILAETDYDAMYILHNHPSGNIEPSKQDIGVTMEYYHTAKEKFVSHIILDHTSYTVITPIGNDQATYGFYPAPEGYHHVEPRKTYSAPIRNPNEVAEFFIQSRNAGSTIFFTDNQGRVVGVQPGSFENIPVSEMVETLKANSYRSALLLFDDPKEYTAFVDSHKGQRLPITDVILVQSGGLVQSAREEGNYEYFDYQKNPEQPLDWNWDETTSADTLFQLSDNKRQEYLKARWRDVKNAVEAHFYIGDAILSEYAGEEWADKEIRFRQSANFTGALDEARRYDDLDEYLHAMEEKSDGNWSEEDEEWFSRVFDYSRIRTPDQSDRIFLQQWASSERNLLALAKRLKGYSYVQTRNGKQSISYRFGSFKGVDRKVVSLTIDSSDEQIREAMDIVYSNPRPYRKALMVVEQAEAGVQEFRGLAASGEASRDAYYDVLGETMEDELAKFEQAEQSEGESRQSKLDERQLRASFEEQERRLLEANAELKALNVKVSADLKASQAQIETYEKKIARLDKERADRISLLNDLSTRIRQDAKKYGRLMRDLSTANRMVRNRDRKIEGMHKDDVFRRRELGKRDTEIRNLKREIAEGKARQKELREGIAGANREIQRLARIKDALQRRLWALAIQNEKERLLKQIKRKSVFNENTMDASYQEAFGFVASLFDKKFERRIVAMPVTLDRYMPEEYLGMIQRDNRISRWTVEGLETLLNAVSLMKTDARLMKDRRDAERASRLQSFAIQVFRQTYGRMPNIDVRALNATGIMNDIAYDIDTSKQRFVGGKESGIRRQINMWRQSFVHIQRFARWLDGQDEGPMYDFFVRTVWENYQNEYRETQRRLEALDAVRKEFGITPGYLKETVAKYSVNGETEVELTREQAIGVYIYNKNEMARMKLLHHSGNGMTEFDVASIVSTLSDKDRAVGDYLIESIGGDAEYERQREAVYEAYNRNLSREENYFPLRAEGVETEGSMDLISGPQRNSVSYVEDGMTKDRKKVYYPLDLNVFNTWLVALHIQEHLIAFARWVKDAQYLLGPSGAVGHTVNVNFGQTSYRTLQGFVNRIAGKREELHDIEKLINPLISRAAASYISYSLSSMMKQVTSLTAGLRGDIDPVVLLRVLMWKSPAPEIRNWKQARQIMLDMDPSMKQRTFNLEVSRFRNIEHSSKAGEIVSKITDKGIEYGTEAVDAQITTRVWWGAYLTQLKKGASVDEAVYRASQFVAETQSSSNPMDLSSIQASGHTFLRALAQFKNDSFQHWNQVFWDLPYYYKNRMWRDFGGTLVSLTLASVFLLALSGAFLSGDGEDDDEKKKRLWKSLVIQLFEDQVPFASEGIVTGLRGFGGDGLVTIGYDFGRLLGEIIDSDDDAEALGNRIWDVIESGASVTGLPTLALRRTVRAFDEQNWWRMLGGYWYRMEDEE